MRRPTDFELSIRTVSPTYVETFEVTARHNATQPCVTDRRNDLQTETLGGCSLFKSTLAGGGDKL